MEPPPVQEHANGRLFTGALRGRQFGGFPIANLWLALFWEVLRQNPNFQHCGGYKL
jgi:hypothetical protein